MTASVNVMGISAVASAAMVRPASSRRVEEFTVRNYFADESFVNEILVGVAY
jgi:hypothetical protein